MEAVTTYRERAEQGDVASAHGRWHKWAHRSPWVILVIGGFLLYGAFQNDMRHDREISAAEQSLARSEIKAAISEEFESQTDVLLGIAALFSSDEFTSRSEFEAYLAASDRPGRNRNVRAVEWAPFIRRDDLDSFEAEVRSDTSVSSIGYPDFAVRTAGDLPFLIPVSYIEPLEGNEPAFGFDLASNPERLAAIDRVRGSVAVVATEPIHLVQDEGSSAGMLLLSAVRSDSSDQVDRFAGVVTSVLDLTAVLGELSVSLPDYVLTDAGRLDKSIANAKVIPIFASSPEVAAQGPKETFVIAGRHWAVQLQSGTSGQTHWMTLFLSSLPRLIALVAVVGAMRILVDRDVVSDRKAVLMTAEIGARNKELVESNEWLESFTRVASHDLRSPLRAINSLVTFIREDSPDLDESAIFNLSRIEDRTGRMNQLIDDLMTLSQAADHHEHEVEVDFQELVGDIIEMIDVPPHIDVTSRCSGSSVARITKTQFTTCMRNLIDNAVKHHDGETGLVHVDLKVGATNIVARVKDDGPGIAAQYLESIFEPFRRLTSSELTPGSGVGLTTLRRTVQANGGLVAVESTEGEGTMFTLTWPVAQSEDSKLYIPERVAS